MTPILAHGSGGEGIYQAIAFGIGSMLVAAVSLFISRRIQRSHNDSVQRKTAWLTRICKVATALAILVPFLTIAILAIADMAK
jgi:hypothetical protein